MRLLLVLAAAAVVGEAFEALKVPGGIFVGAMVGAAAVNLGGGLDAHLPRALDDAGLIVVAAAIGMKVDRATLATFKGMLPPALLSAVLIILAGVGISFLLRAIGWAPEGDVLATSPGALASVGAVASRLDIGPVQVAFFHTVRLVLVILSLPLVARLLRT